MLNGYPYGYNELQSSVQAYLPVAVTLIYDVAYTVGLLVQTELAMQATTALF